jgi:N-acetylmuramic acid 6-phosphate etherase
MLDGVAPGYEDLPTEEIRPDGPELDVLEPEEIARCLLAEEERAVAAVAKAIGAIGEAAAAAAKSLKRGGRIVYVGAGTSGRLGVLDAAEMGPTFGADPGQVVALLAGGPGAVHESVEGAEDDAQAGHADMAALRPRERDCVVGITMSGTAAYVAAALSAAHAAGARRVLVTANGDSSIAADIRVVLELGPEALAGSTRLKGGSATKAVLNMISTAAMAGSGAVYRNLMVRVRPLNRKLRDRAERLVTLLGGTDRERAARLLVEAGGDVRVAVLMAKRGYGAFESMAILKAHKGSLREALR